MNTKRTLFGVLACLVFTFAAVSCTSTTEDELYEQGVDKTKIRINKNNAQGVDKTKIRVPGR
ncbi:hypothetical protein [Spongiimicrobium salis]|uniref:hypothetical protein n=1 Tax=Spongiimicrobium salis TaxID=1667022 RepID=UPI00374D484F